MSKRWLLLLPCLALVIAPAATAEQAARAISFNFTKVEWSAVVASGNHTGMGSGTVPLGSTRVAWRLTLQASPKGLRGTLTLGKGANSVVLGITASVAAGDVNGDGFSGIGTYTVKGGRGALRQRFAAPSPKSVLFDAIRESSGALQISFNFDKIA